MKKLIILSSVIFILFTNITYSQQIFKDDCSETAYYMRGNYYIFEGMFISSKYYVVTKDGKVVTEETYTGGVIYGNYLTSNIIQITKVFKGGPVIKPGTVEIITLGGRMGNINEVVSDDIGLGVGGTGVYVCSVSTHKSSGFPTDNNKSLNALEGFTYRPFTIPPVAVYGLGCKFNTLSEFYSFLKQLPNITFTDTTIHPLIKKYFNAGIKK